jgi:hypothetical protein
MCVLLVFRIRETPNPDKPVDLSIRIFFELKDFRHVSSYDGRSSIILGFREIKFQCPPILLNPEIPTGKMSMALDHHHVSQLTDNPDSVSGFRDM